MSFSHPTAVLPSAAINSLLQTDRHPGIDPPHLQANSLRRLFFIDAPLAFCLAPLIYGDKR
jgi:hypothetical protein